MPPPRIYTPEQRKERKNARTRERYKENPEKKKEYREKNKEKIKEYQKKYNATENGKKSQRISSWKHLRMICEDWESLYEIYIYTWNCEYCETPFKNTKDRHLDHNHETGEIRGILCNRCNCRDVLK